MPTNNSGNWTCISSRHKDAKDNLSVTLKNGTPVCCCHCDLKGDSFKVIEIMEGLKSFPDIFNKACEILRIDNISSNRSEELPKQQQTPPPQEKPKKNHSSLIGEWSKNAGATDYFKNRGLSDEIISKYKLGYNSNGGMYGKAFKYMIPVSETFVIFREEGNENGRFRNAGDTELLNGHYIASEHIRDIFIVEGAFDALSIEVMGFNAIALNSTSSINMLLETLEVQKHQLKKKQFILIPDNDADGEKSIVRLEEGFDKLGLNLEVKRIPASVGKDANDYLIADRKQFNSFLTGIVNPYIDGYLDEFLNNIQDETKRPKAIKTGFNGLDKFLNGGLYSGLYAIGGISSLGKTSVILQMGDYIAKNGTDVIFFSLEMSRNELIAKSLSRTIFEMAGIKTSVSDIGTREILNADNNKIWGVLQTATSDYRKTAKNLVIHEGNFETGIDEIKLLIKKHIQKTGKHPVIIIDYLQILKGKDKFNDKQNADYLVSELKRMSRDLSIPVIAISSFNRANYGTCVSYESFKESGGIEYGADVLMGLQLSIVKELDLKESNKASNKVKLDQAKKETPRKIDLVILKNRNGEPNAIQEFEFYARNNYFREV
jgi:replicative DNA helicase